MQVLLTGANGFVGSHILDALRARNLGVSVLLRPGSDRRFIASPLDGVAVHEGSILEPASLDRALRDATHVIHCAGATRALRTREFFEVNEGGTRNVIDAVNRHGAIQRVIHISSLAAVGTATRGTPLTQQAPNRPGSTYGHSKLAAEEQVRGFCQTEYTILRPPAVYGPRDAEFLRLFKVVQAGIKPVFGNDQQKLSFAYVTDLASATVHCLKSSEAAGQTFFVAEEASQVTTGEFADLVANVAGCRARTVTIPLGLLYLLCLGQDALSQITRRASVISRHKFAEYRAEALTCDASKLATRTGFVCATSLPDGLTQTLAWYRQHHWV